MTIGVGDYVRFNQGFHLLGIHEHDHATVIGVARWGEWMVLCGETDNPIVRAFPSGVFEVIESAAKRAVLDKSEGVKGSNT